MTPSDWNVVGWIGFGIIVLIGYLIQYAAAAIFAATLFLLTVIWWRAGVFTWRRLALRPARLYARGQHDRAEDYYLRARTYAETKFRTDDFRRGLMMTALGDFAAQTARPALAEDLFQHALRILCRVIENHPVEYLTCVNNYAAMQVNWKNYDKAQAILELAVDIVRPYSEHGRVKVGMAPVVIRYNLVLVCILLKQADAAEGHLAKIDPATVGRWGGMRKLVRDLVVVLRARLCCLRGAYEEALHECSQIKRLSAFVALSRCQALMGLQRHAEAEAAALQALLANKALAPTHPYHLDFQVVLVECALAQREWRQAQ